MPAVLNRTIINHIKFSSMEDNKKTTAVEMTEEQLAQFKEFQERKAAEEKQAAEKKMREDYRSMVDEAIEALMPDLKDISDNLASYKKKVFEDFKAILELKGEMFRLNDKALDNQSHTFTNSEGTKRIVIGNYVTDGYLDTADDGIAKVKEYIASLAKDDDSRALVSMVMRLLAKDAKGTLKASRIIQLRKMAEESGNADFIDGVRIIEDAYQPQVSRLFLKAYVRNAGTGAWDQIPLGMTEA